jgi:hypothetical protein
MKVISTFLATVGQSGIVQARAIDGRTMVTAAWVKC